MAQQHGFDHRGDGCFLVSGTTGTLSYNSMDQVSSISYGSGNDKQLLAYDSLHRLTSDTVQTS